MKRSSFCIPVAFMALASFALQDEAGCQHAGLKGHVYFVSGNRMPSPDVPPPTPKGTKTTLYIYELTNISQVSREGTAAFYKNISTALVKEVETNEDGSYKVKLNPGKYSLFVKKGDVFYSNIFDAQNNIHPVEVIKGKMTEENFQVDYGAVY